MQRKTGGIIPEFKKEKFGALPTTIKLTRKQIEQMHQMIDHFKDQENFELRYDDGKITFHFTMEFDSK